MKSGRRAELSHVPSSVQRVHFGQVAVDKLSCEVDCGRLKPEHWAALGKPVEQDHTHPRGDVHLALHVDCGCLCRDGGCTLKLPVQQCRDRGLVPLHPVHVQLLQGGNRRHQRCEPFPAQPQAAAALLRVVVAVECPLLPPLVEVDLFIIRKMSAYIEVACT